MSHANGHLLRRTPRSGGEKLDYLNPQDLNIQGSEGYWSYACLGG